MNKKCSICGTTESKIKQCGLCERCYQREWYRKKHGIKRTKNDENEIITYDDYAEIILYDKKGKEKDRAIIDIEDIDKIKEYKWYSSNKYVCSKCKTTNGKCIFLHRLIMDAKDEEVVDHIDHNPLNNRKSNLRKCTQHQNAMNKLPRKSNTGVFMRAGKWEARIMYNYKNIYLGRFDSKVEAIKSRKEAEEKYFGEFKYKE